MLTKACMTVAFNVDSFMLRTIKKRGVYECQYLKKAAIFYWYVI